MLISHRLFSALENVVVLLCILWDGSKLFWWGCEIPLNVQTVTCYYLCLFFFRLLFSEDLALHQSRGAAELLVLYLVSVIPAC